MAGQVEMGEMSQYEPCPSCDGYGYTPNKRKPQQEWPQCPDCQGKGEKPQQ